MNVERKKSLINDQGNQQSRGKKEGEGRATNTMNEEKGMHGNESNPYKRTETKARGRESLKRRKM